MVARHIRLELRHDGICPSESVLTLLREVQLPNVNMQRMNPTLTLGTGLTLGGRRSAVASAGRSVVPCWPTGWAARCLQIVSLIQRGGAAILYFALSNLDSFSVWELVPGMLIAGLGAGLVIASSIGVAIFGSTFFAAVTIGEPGKGFRNALLIQAALVSVFVAVSPFLCGEPAPRVTSPGSLPRRLRRPAKHWSTGVFELGVFSEVGRVSSSDESSTACPHPPAAWPRIGLELPAATPGGGHSGPHRD
jgi:hypothetical protein